MVNKDVQVTTVPFNKTRWKCRQPITALHRWLHLQCWCRCLSVETEAHYTQLTLMNGWRAARNVKRIRTPHNHAAVVCSAQSSTSGNGAKWDGNDVVKHSGLAALLVYGTVERHQRAAPRHRKPVSTTMCHTLSSGWADYPRRPRQSRGYRVSTAVCLFFKTISQKPMQPASPHLTYKCSTKIHYFGIKRSKVKVITSVSIFRLNAILPLPLMHM